MDTKDLCEHTRIRLIAAAVGHQQCTKTESALIPLPGTPKFIAIGTLPAIAKVLMVEPPAVAASIPPSTAPAPQTATEAQILAAARALADRSADSCNVNRDDNWMIYSSEFIEDARIAFTAAAKAAPAPQQRKPSDELRERVRDAVSNALHGVYYCGRVWEAWQVNTMREDDFTPAAEVDDVLEGIVDAALVEVDQAAQAAPSAPTEKVEQGKFAERLYGPKPTADERRDALHTLALIFAAAETDSAREACFEDMYSEFLAVPRMSIFDGLTRHTGAEISTNYTFETEEFFEVEAVERVLRDASKAAPSAKAEPVQFDEDELRKLILHVSNTSHWCGRIGGDADDYEAALDKAIAADGKLFNYVKNLAAPAPAVQAEDVRNQATEPEAEECWSANEEDFNATSLDQLLSENDHLKAGDTVWVGEAVRPDPAQLVNEDGIIENIGEAAYDIAGEHAEDYPEVTNEQAKELESLVADWIKRTCPPTFWTVTNIRPYRLSHDDFPNDSTPIHANIDFAAPSTSQTSEQQGGE